MNKELNWLQRLSSPTPKFFKKITRFFIALGTLSLSLQLLPKETLDLYPFISTLSTHLASISAIGVAISRFPVDFDKLENNDTAKD